MVGHLVNKVGLQDVSKGERLLPSLDLKFACLRSYSIVSWRFVGYVRFSIAWMAAQGFFGSSDQTIQ